MFRGFIVYYSLVLCLARTMRLQQSQRCNAHQAVTLPQVDGIILCPRICRRRKPALRLVLHLFSRLQETNNSFLNDVCVMSTMLQASRRGACRFAAVLLLLVSLLRAASQPSTTVGNGFELHAALASGSITQIWVAGNVSVSSSCNSSTGLILQAAYEQLHEHPLQEGV